MKYKIDEGLILAYKSMLIDRMKDVNHWSIYQYRKYTNSFNKECEYDTTIYNDRSGIYFIIHFNGTIDMKINSDLIHTFNKLDNLDLIFLVHKFRKEKRDEEKNKIIKKKEELMKDTLPDEYKRAIKIHKIKNQM